VAGSVTTATTDTAENSTVTVPPVRKKVWVMTGGWVVVGGANDVVVVVEGIVVVVVVDVVEVVGVPGIVEVVDSWLPVGDALDVVDTFGVPPEPVDCEAPAPLPATETVVVVESSGDVSKG